MPPGSHPGTSVSFFPDLARFGMEIIDELHKSLIHQRILNLSVLYPQIRFKFNKRVVKIDAKKFMSMFSDTFEYIEEDNYLIGIFPNEAADFSYHTYVNSLWLEKGGNHVSFLTGKIVDELRSKLVRKYKSIKPGDIKNKISTVIFFRNFPNAKFDGQTKEFLTNTQKEITSFLNFNDPENKKDWERFTTKLYKNKAIIDPITDLYNAKMLIEEKKRLKDATKKQDVPEKYWPATKGNKYLFLSEGDSAIGAITAELGRDYNGFFPLKGVPLNVVKDRSKVAKNAEIKQIANILGIDLSTNSNENLSYENIVIASDRDVDGSHIAGILLGLFATYAPDYLKDGRIFLFVTPLVTVQNKKGQIKFMFTMEEYEAFRKKYDPKGNKFVYDYKKGLGSMEEDEWVELFKQFKLEDLLQPLHLKGSSDAKMEMEELVNWLADNSDFRKEKILQRIKDFDINKV
jgi:DNA topoisomerase-2